MVYKMFLVLMLAVCTTSQAGMEKPITVSLFLINKDNINNATASADKRSDNIIEVKFNMDFYKRYTEKTAVIASGMLTTQDYADFDFRSNNEIGAQVNFFFKPVNSFTAPRYGLSVMYAIQKASDVERDVSLIQLTPNIAFNLTDKVRISSGYNIFKQSSDGDTVFDADRTRLYVNADYALDRKQTLYFTSSLIQGDVVQETNLPEKAAGFKHGHGGEEVVTPEGFNLSAYDVDSTVFNLGYNRVLDASSAFDIAYQLLAADAEGENYDVNTLSVGYLRKF